MKASIKILMTASVLAVAAAGAASAARLDFTDETVYTTKSAASATGTIGAGPTETKWTLTPTGGILQIETNPDGKYDGGSTAPAELALDYDGVGIGKRDDEITAEKNESLLLSFSRSIFLTAVHVLDLFKSADTEQAAGQREHALVYDPTTLILTIEAIEQLASNPDNGGYQTKKLDKAVEVAALRFEAGGSDDNPTNTRDFALAAVDYEFDDPDRAPAPIPLPAGGLLLLGALGGLGLAKRRRKAA